MAETEKQQLDVLGHLHDRSPRPICGKGAVMLAMAFATALLLHLTLFATAPMATIIMDDMQLTHAEFGIIFAVAMVSLVIWRIPWGIASDRFGYVKALRIALPLTAAAAVLRVISSGYPTLLLSQFGLGLGLSAILPCLPLLIQEWGKARAGIATGMYVSGFAAGNAAALALTPFLMSYMSWRIVLLVYTAYAVMLAVLWWLVSIGHQANEVKVRMSAIGVVLRDRLVWRILVLMIVAMGSYDTLATWMPNLLEIKGVNPSLAALLPLGFFLAGPVIGAIGDRFRERRVLVVGQAVIGAAAIVSFNLTLPPVFLAGVFLAGFCAIGLLTVALSIPAQDPRLSAALASVVGITSALGNIGPLVMPVLYGWLIDITGTHQVSILAVAALIVLPLLLVPGLGKR